jgi:DNA-binding transcriptional regulator YdaS (Cro superfamily)
MFYLSQNYVKIAVDRLGGPTRAATAMAVSGTTIHTWIKRQRIVDIDKAKVMAKLTGIDLQQLRSTPVMTEKLLKQASIADINAALKRFRGPSFVEPPKQVVDCDEYKQLNRLQIDQGVIALVLACNLSGGSVGDMDLYRLIRTYLLDQSARDEINDVVMRHMV